MNRRHFLAAAMLAAGGCSRRDSRVVLYCAQDREFAEDLLADFTRETGLEVAAKYDTEAQKSVGLAAELEQEASRPRCDVHWNNEPLATIRLARAGVYAPYASPVAAPFPTWTRAPDQTWQAFAARARVLIVNTTLVPAKADRPQGLRDLIAPQWKGRVAMAKPFFGTTATHAACLFAALGRTEATAFFDGLATNGVAVVAGNKQVATEVSNGRYAVGLTDTDDALIELHAGKPIAIVYPDGTGPAALGTLFLPNTLAVVRDGPNPTAARKLVDFLLRPETEQRLAEGGGFQVPLNPAVRANLPAGLLTPAQVRAMEVDFGKASDCWDETQTVLRGLFGG